MSAEGDERESTQQRANDRDETGVATRARVVPVFSCRKQELEVNLNELITLGHGDAVSEWPERGRISLLSISLLPRPLTLSSMKLCYLAEISNIGRGEVG